MVGRAADVAWLTDVTMVGRTTDVTMGSPAGVLQLRIFKTETCCSHFWLAGLYHTQSFHMTSSDDIE